MPADRLAKRSAAQERLRGSFLSAIGSQLQELAALFSDGTDESRDSAIAEMDRIARTAGALGIDALAAAASEGVHVEDSATVERRLEPLARVMRTLQERPLFAPIGVVGDDDLIGRFRKQRTVTPEPLKIATHLEGLRDPLSIVPFSALLVPVEQVEEALTMADGAPVIGWGEGRDWEARLRCVQAGASGFVKRRSAVVDLLDRVRCHTAMSTEAVEVFVIADETPERQSWIDALKATGASVVTSCQPHEIAPALDVVCPDTLVIGGTVGGVDAQVLIRALRTHGSRAHVPALVIGADLDGNALRDAGADDILPVGVDPEDVARRVHQRYQRMLTIRRGRHPVSTMLDRPATLRALGRRLGNAHRDSQPLSVAAIHVSGLVAARQRWGKAAANAAQQLCAEGIDAGIRRIDLAGQLNADTFLVALHRCDAQAARRRVTDLARRIELRLHSDHRLREMICLFGVADTEAGLAGVAVRAEEDLRAVRRTSP